MYKDGSPSGQWVINKQDLKRPGGTYVFSLGQVLGRATIKTVVDIRNVVQESNKNNNSMERTFSCSTKLPDLSIGVSFSNDCRTVVTLKNIGQAELSPYMQNYITVHRTIDGKDKGHITLKTADPSFAVRLPGGQAVWTDYPDFRANNNVKYTVESSSNEETLSNNVASANVPSQCVSGQQPQRGQTKQKRYLLNR